MGERALRGGAMTPPERTVVQDGDPLPGVAARDIADRLGDSPSECSLAEAIAVACGKAGHLMHLVEEDDGLAEELGEWSELEERLWRMALDALARDGVAPGKGPGMMRIIAPFMERNGYVDASGWWVRADGDCEDVICGQPPFHVVFDILSLIFSQQ